MPRKTTSPGTFHLVGPVQSRALNYIYSKPDGATTMEVFHHVVEATNNPGMPEAQAHQSIKRLRERGYVAFSHEVVRQLSNGSRKASVWKITKLGVKYLELREPHNLPAKVG